ncbi:CesT family type III secretion system chaperone [Ramlibacter sp. MAHUQ-53]|uniref:hypothetical protein n=1 Tax=unclassified Ramlibacter TaxID=2617605 RepID=UPI0036420C14
MTMTTIHPLARAYADRNGLGPEAFRPDGRLVLEFDDRYRVQLRPASEGRIALVARLADLGQWPRGMADDLLLRLSAKGAGLLRAHAAGLVIEEAFDSLQLQRVLPNTLGVEGLEKELGAFLNLLTFWRDVCSEWAARRVA